ncbi:hypothetical protein [Nocardioides dongxiaopingii]|uniref:hypothetical protein n=1 Tax=Nocardioides dongxiaopingii TaxID=2576036 RepID=UPI0010C76395|nr:hypothetical protein [Nocardioides dongxiaopingii]
MSYALSRLMSTATASYAGFCFVRPEHLGVALEADKDEQAGYDLLAEVFGVRDLAISTFGILGRSERTVRTAMWIRILCDVGDGVVLAARADDDAVRTKVLATTLSWGALNLAALQIDKRRARRAAAGRETAAVTGTAVAAVDPA